MQRTRDRHVTLSGLGLLLGADLVAFRVGRVTDARGLPIHDNLGRPIGRPPDWIEAIEGDGDVGALVHDGTGCRGGPHVVATGSGLRFDYDAVMGDHNPALNGRVDSVRALGEAIHADADRRRRRARAVLRTRGERESQEAVWWGPHEQTITPAMSIREAAHPPRSRTLNRDQLATGAGGLEPPTF